jgi:geranylgeranyl diphosphate synthase type I
VGTAFQIQDDLLDVYGDPDQTGKPLFSDFREGIPTLLSLDAYARLEGRERSEFERLFTSRRKRPAELLRLKELTEVAGARALTVTEALRQVDRGVRALQELPGGPYRDLLERIARGVISRTY